AGARSHHHAGPGNQPEIVACRAARPAKIGSAAWRRARGDPPAESGGGPGRDDPAHQRCGRGRLARARAQAARPRAATASDGDAKRARPLARGKPIMEIAEVAAKRSNVIPSLFLDFMQMQEFAKAPLVFTEGRGNRLRTSDGQEFIDGLSGVFVTSLGHRDPAVIDAITAQLNQLAFAPPLHGTTPAALDLAQLLLRIAPEGVTAVKLLSGGSEATEAAMKLARQYHKQTGNPRKYKIISRYGAYHGGTMGALSAGGGRDRKSVFEPLGVGFIHVHPPFCYHCPFDQSYPECGRTCVELIERTIEAEDPATVAAVIVPPPDYLARLRDICSLHNVVLIYDEIITGFGRLGTMFASQYYRAAPDITCCGKGMSGGYAPLAAILIRDRIAAAF